MARFPEYDDWSDSFKERSAEFDYNTVEARRCLDEGDIGERLCHNVFTAFLRLGLPSGLFYKYL
jgi:hypothetical protein